MNRHPHGPSDPRAPQLRLPAELTLAQRTPGRRTPARFNDATGSSRRLRGGGAWLPSGACEAAAIARAPRATAERRVGQGRGALAAFEEVLLVVVGAEDEVEPGADGDGLAAGTSWMYAQAKRHG